MPAMHDDQVEATTTHWPGMRGVVHGSLHLFSGQLVRVFGQSLYFVLVTRGLGAEDFGRYTAVQALLLGLVPFTSLGFPILAIRAVARDPSQRRAIWSGGLWVVLALGGVASLMVTMLAPGLLKISFPRLPLFLFTVSELVFYGLVNLLTGVLQGEERLDRMARVLVGLSLARLAAVALVYFGPGLDLATFAAAHLAGTLLCLCCALLAYGGAWAWPPPAFNLHGFRSLAAAGFYIALTASGRGFLMGLDRMMMPALAGLTTAAQYGAGFRVAAFALMPLQAFMAALYPRFFRRGAQSLSSGLALWRRSAPMALLYAVPVATLLFFAAPLLGPLLGVEYPEAPTVLRHLAWLLILQALYTPLGDALSGADHFAYRSASILIALVGNLGLNLWLIPDLGWRGAVLAAYSAHLLLLLLYAAKAISVSRRERAQGRTERNTR